MAKYESRVQGNFDDFLSYLHQGILRGSASASFENGSDYYWNDALRCAVRVYERYSMIGSNRVSLNVTVVGNGNDLFVSAITSGGSQAVFFKINTFGEGAFLDNAVRVIESYRRGRF